ncbi:unnamed protein product [Cuscuta campestris]|uniref:Uncharacterized protein n=1 Tax=Cuscuta campestris TaxID=132261 RepID=A0A484NQZ2_9ASTE|nr:unnamed protein product [Cuscuta campestris]
MPDINLARSRHGFLHLPQQDEREHHQFRLLNVSSQGCIRTDEYMKNKTTLIRINSVNLEGEIYMVKQKINNFFSKINETK